MGDGTSPPPLWQEDQRRIWQGAWWGFHLGFMVWDIIASSGFMWPDIGFMGCSSGWYDMLGLFFNGTFMVYRDNTKALSCLFTSFFLRLVAKLARKANVQLSIISRGFNLCQAACLLRPFETVWGRRVYNLLGNAW